MVTGNLENEIVVLYDRLHELYVDYIRFNDVCPTNECVENIEKVYKVINSVNDCMIHIALGGMSTADFLDTVNLNELYSAVFYIASEVQNVAIEGPDSSELIELRSKIHDDVNAIYAAIQDVMHIFIEVSNN